MPTNLTKEYNAVLELFHLTENENLKSLRRVFDRDFNNGIVNKYKGRLVLPTPEEGVDVMDRQFRHLTTVIVDESTKSRSFDSERAIRIHWIKAHFDNRCKFLSFIVKDENRVYLLNKDEKYVIVMEPKSNEHLYLLTAYKLYSSRFKKMMNKLEKRGEVI